MKNTITKSIYVFLKIGRKENKKYKVDITFEWTKNMDDNLSIIKNKSIQTIVNQLIQKEWNLEKENKMGTDFCKFLFNKLKNKTTLLKTVRLWKTKDLYFENTF